MARYLSVTVAVLATLALVFIAGAQDDHKVWVPIAFHDYADSALAQTPTTNLEGTVVAAVQTEVARIMALTPTPTATPASLIAIAKPEPTLPAGYQVDIQPEIGDTEFTLSVRLFYNGQSVARFSAKSYTTDYNGIGCLSTDWQTGDCTDWSFEGTGPILTYSDTNGVLRETFALRARPLPQAVRMLIYNSEGQYVFTVSRYLKSM